MDERYRVLLVDDEPIILRSLRAVIPWERHGMEVVGEARSGEEALTIAQERRPHLILSDIRMPMMDGIALMKEVMSSDESVIFIILSGYGEFTYAREAIRQGAFDYLLKPIDHEELETVVMEARKKLDGERTQRSEHEYLRKSVQSLSSVVREWMLADMIEGVRPASDHLYWLQEWELEFPFHMMLVALDDYDALAREWNSEERRLWLFAVRNILQEFGDQRQCLTMFSLHNGEWVLIFQNASLGDIESMADSVIKLVRQYTKLSCSVALSGRHEDLPGLNAAYQDVQRAIMNRFIHGKGRVYGMTDAGSGGETAAARQTELNWPQLEKRLLLATQTLDTAAFELALREVESHFAGQGMERHAAAEKLLQLSVVLHRSLESLSLRPIDGIDSLLHKLLVSGTLQEMTQLLLERFDNWVCSIASQQSEETGRGLIAKATEYIASRYHHDLGIDEVSEYVGLSASHFCVLFKQETGMTFLDYLTRMRMEKACSILRHSEVKVYQIAPLVGYQDPRYFAQVFKKMTGMTPTEYRANAIQ